LGRTDNSKGVEGHGLKDADGFGSLGSSGSFDCAQDDGKNNNGKEVNLF
jgi:hypothetical protein